KDLFLSEKDLRAFVPYLALVHFTASTGETPRRRDEKPPRSREGFVSLRERSSGLRATCALIRFAALTGESPRRRDEKPPRSREGFVSLRDLRPSCHISLWFTSQRRRANHHE